MNPNIGSEKSPDAFGMSCFHKEKMPSKMPRMASKERALRGYPEGETKLWTFEYKTKCWISIGTSKICNESFGHGGA